MSLDPEAKLNEYRARASDAVAAGADAVLEHVRAKHEKAAQVWTELADAEQARLEDRARRQAQLAS